MALRSSIGLLAAGGEDVQARGRERKRGGGGDWTALQVTRVYLDTCLLVTDQLIFVASCSVTVPALFALSS